ncbi:MAG: 8-oxoguanine DNA glycosylase [Clostridia bacterium]|nr:8-oxoguanine DNA glycosylase [Clostridia bacterium]
MEYKGYSIKRQGNTIIVSGVRDFNPVHIFECGQSFRWAKQGDGSYTGIVRDKVVNIRFEEEALTINNASEDDFIELWYDYFDLGTDYGSIKKQLELKDPFLNEAVHYGYGIRLLKQDLWETLISFIISSNNNIPRITKIITAIAKTYGQEIDFGGCRYYTFPDYTRLAGTSLEQLEVCRGGYRCKYIVQTAAMVAERKVNLDRLEEMDTEKARAELMKLSGIGPKVADCILLFSGAHRDVFPTDVWVKRVMEELYFKREAGIKEIQEFAMSYFGELVGFAQQYLFYYAREKRVGMK